MSGFEGFKEAQAKSEKSASKAKPIGKKEMDVLVEAADLTEDEESAIREKFGYSESGTRTKAERDESARKMVSVPDIDLPPDIEAVWGEGRLDGLGCLAANTARALIDAWGIEKFRLSEIHVQAAAALRRDRSMEQARADFAGVEFKTQTVNLSGGPNTGFTPAARPSKPKSKGRSETCVHRIAPGNYCKFGCD